MKYISVGVMEEYSQDKNLKVSHCSGLFELSGLRLELWLRGKSKFTEAVSKPELTALEQLETEGLVIVADNDDSGEYYALTKAVIITFDQQESITWMHADEKWMLTWLWGAGLHLTAAELVFLNEHKVSPDQKYMGEANRQALVEMIYTRDTIYDNLLEFEMAAASSRDATVRTVLELLKKGHIYLI